MIKAVIFDFFGVVGLSTYAMMAEKYHFTVEQRTATWDLHRAYDAGYVSRKEFYQAYADIIGISETALVAAFQEAESHMGIHQPVIDWADELRQVYKVALLSNVSQQAYHFITPIEQHFDTIIASFQVRIAKPDRVIYELMAQKLGVDASDCVMIDDSTINCQGAITAGMQAVLYTSLADAKKQLVKLL